MSVLAVLLALGFRWGKRRACVALYQACWGARGMTGRKCGSCKHYEPAPIWRKGWCRNALLYSPQQSHLVGEEDLDCERGMGNYWESSQASGPLPYIPLHPVSSSSQSNDAVSVSDSRAGYPLRTPSGQAIFPVSGSSGYSGDQIDDDLPPTSDRRDGDPRGRERQLDYYTEERYWTDYVRIGLPILGVILILLVALLWIIPFFNGDDDDGQLGATGSPTTTIPVIQPSVTATSPANGSETPRITLTTQPGTTPPATTGEPTATTATEPQPSGGEIYPGATVAVANTGGTGVNMRSTASVDGEVVAVVLDGTEFVTTGEAEEADGFVWWPVQGEAGTGYIVEDYLTLVQ